MSRKATLLIVPGKRIKICWEQVVIHPRKIKIVPYYVSNLEISPYATTLANTLRSQFGNKIIIVYLGRLTKGKGLSYLIEAFAKLR